MAHDLTVRRTINASREELFDAWLDPASLDVWMAPMPGFTATTRTDPRVGGRFDILMHGPEQDYPHTGEYKVIDRPSKLVFTWISNGTQQQETVVTVDFLERGEGTEVVLTHVGFPDAESMRDHTEGWTEILENLSRVRAAA